MSGPGKRCLVSFLLFRFRYTVSPNLSVHRRKGTRKKVQNKSENCLLRVTQRGLISGKRGHPTSSSLRFTVSVPRNFFLFFHFVFWIHHIAFISSRFSCTACHSPLSSVWSLSSSAPWKPRASWQKCTSAHTRPYSLQKGQSIWTFLFQQLLAGMAKHKTGSVRQKQLLFIDWGQEWLNG